MDNYDISSIQTIKPFYEKEIHKKVFNFDVIMAIPYGIKYYAWFTIHNGEHSCLIMQYNHENNTIRHISRVHSCCDNVLCSGTLLYGTIIKYKNYNFFTIEDILKYKTKNMLKLSYITRLNAINKLLSTELIQSNYNNNFLVFGVPLIDIRFNNILQKIKDLPYEIQYLQYRYFKNNKIVNLQYNKPKTNHPSQYIHHNNKYNTNKTIFKVIATPEADTYDLYTINKKENVYEYYQKLQIQDYKTSVNMNGIFRVIKENIYLDALEESDEDCDDEDIDTDEENINNKFIIKNKEVFILCEYLHKFKKWAPIKEVYLNDTNNVVSSNDIIINQ
jgi:hypothetical protein